MLCPAAISWEAGAMKEDRKPWKAITIPAVNFPRITSSTPRPITAMFAAAVIALGSVPRNRFSLV